MVKKIKTTKKKTKKSKPEEIIYYVKSKRELKRILESGRKTRRGFSVGLVLSNVINYLKDKYIISELVLIGPFFMYFLLGFLSTGLKNAGVMEKVILLIAYLLCYSLMGFASILLIEILNANDGKNGREWLQDRIKYCLTRVFNVLGVVLISSGALLLFILPFVMFWEFFKKYNAAAFVYLLIVLFPIAYLGLTYGQAWIIALLEPESRNSFKDSADLTAGKKGGMLLVYFVFAILLAIANMPLVTIITSMFRGLQSVVDEKLFSLIITCVLNVILFPLYSSFNYSLYRELKDSTPSI